MVHGHIAMFLVPSGLIGVIVKLGRREKKPIRQVRKGRERGDIEVCERRDRVERGMYQVGCRPDAILETEFMDAFKHQTIVEHCGNPQAGWCDGRRECRQNGLGLQADEIVQANRQAAAQTGRNRVRVPRRLRQAVSKVAGKGFAGGFGQRAVLAPLVLPERDWVKAQTRSGRVMCRSIDQTGIPRPGVPMLAHPSKDRPLKDTMTRYQPTIKYLQ